MRYDKNDLNRWAQRDKDALRQRLDEISSRRPFPYLPSAGIKSHCSAAPSLSPLLSLSHLTRALELTCCTLVSIFLLCDGVDGGTAVVAVSKNAAEAGSDASEGAA